MSLVLQSGVDGFACLVKGNYNVLHPAGETGGYLDCEAYRQFISSVCNTANVDPAAMTEYLLLQALKLSPRLLLDVRQILNWLFGSMKVLTGES